MKIRSLTTVAGDGQPYCISFQTRAGCPYEDGDGGVACPHKHAHTWQWHTQIVRARMALGGCRAAPAIIVSQRQQWMPQQYFPEDFTAAMKVDSGLRALDSSLERTVTGNIEKRPIHDLVDKKRSIQMFSITPAGQTWIPLCSPAGVKSRHVQSWTMGSGEA